MMIMHEISIVKDLSDIVLEVADREKLSKVTKVNISFGQMIQVVPDIFEFAFKETVRDTIAMDAVVDIEILPVKTRCRICKLIDYDEDLLRSFQVIPEINGFDVITSTDGENGFLKLKS